MQRTIFSILLIVHIGVAYGQLTTSEKDINADLSFKKFETDFLDNYWKQYPSNSIFIGYGKYYENLVIPGDAAIASNLSFSQNWLHSLKSIRFDQLSDNDKISYKIIKNELESDAWYQNIFKQYEWDASVYNLAAECYYLVNQPYASLDERLRILSRHLHNSDAYYKAAFKILNRPTVESCKLAILQNENGLDVFGSSLTDSINASHLADSEKDNLHQNITKTVSAIRTYVDSLKSIVSSKKYVFRNFSIGKKLFADKFRYDLVTDLTPEQVYGAAIAEQKLYYNKMFAIANHLWNKYYGAQLKPKDTLQIVQLLFDKIQLQHARPQDFFDSLTNQVYQLKKFIIAKNLFDFDTTYPVVVRIMPSYESGVTIASAEFTPPYQQQGTTYYNIDDLTKYAKDKAESALREANNYYSQLLSIHEAMPGHCLQGIYNSKKSSDVLRSVFQNGAMIEGWAVYAETMMLENGWGNNTPEMQLIFDKLKLRELANVIIDYGMQCLHMPKEAVLNLLVKQCFQTTAQAEEKYKRATLSQVQLCSYYTGSRAIFALREAYKKKTGSTYSVKDFHEKFLSYGSAPVKYISEIMLK